MSSSKSKRCFTIMIVPHSEEATYSLRIPLYVVQALVILLVLGVTGLGVLGYAYLMAAAEAQEAQDLRERNRAQQEEIDSLAVETERVIEQMNEIDKLIDSVTEQIGAEELEEIEGINDEDEDEVEDEDEENGEASNNQSFPSPSNSVSSSNSIYPSNSSSAYLLEKSGYIEHELSYMSRSSSNGVLDRASENITFLKEVTPDLSTALDEVGSYVDYIRAKPEIWPARGRITSGFGTRETPYGDGYQFHTGVDIAGSHGSTVWATADGEVIYSGYRGSLGNLLIICHGNGYETHFAHLEDFAVQAGEEVEKGQTIGYMGRTGRTTGTHLHYEVHHDGSPVNPMRYMEKQ